MWKFSLTFKGVWFWHFFILLILGPLDCVLSFTPRQMLRVREAVVSLLQFQDSGFQQLSLVVEKGLMQVNLHGTWLPDRKALNSMASRVYLSNASYHVCAHDNGVMGTFEFFFAYIELQLALNIHLL